MGQPTDPSASTRQLINLGRTLQTLREEDNVDVLMETTLGYLQTEFAYSLLWIGLYDRLEHRLLGKGGLLPNGDSKFSLLRQRFTLSPGDLLEQVVIQQRPIGVSNLQQEMRAGEWRRVAEKFDVKGTLLFPIRYRDRCFGLVLMGSPLWGVSPRSEDRAMLSMLLGELATTLYQIETTWQRQQTKHPEQPLLGLLSELRLLPTFAERLEAVVERTHTFVTPSRTNIYWFERERRYFWRRWSNHQLNILYPELKQSASGITVQELGSFYEALTMDQLVSIGESHSSLKAEVTSKLMQQIRARSLLAAPILFQNELLGFLAVEGSQARIWLEEEKSYVRGAAQLVALTAPLEQMETTIQQVKLDQALMAEMNRAIHNDSDWKQTLQTCADSICKRLKAERFLVLLFDPDLNHFEVCYQGQPANRRPIANPLPTLAEVDEKLLEKSREPIGLENLDDSLKLLAWQEIFLQAGMRSLLVCNTSLGTTLEGLVLIGHEVTRTWSQAEREIVRVVSQQIGLILHQWRLQHQTEQQRQLHQVLERGLTTIQQSTDVNRLEQVALQHLMQVLQAPLVGLVSWQSGQTEARIVVPATSDLRFAIDPDSTLSLKTDALMQVALNSNGLVRLSATQLSSSTRRWLVGQEIGQVLVMTLRTHPNHEPTGVVVVVDVATRQWFERQLSAFGVLVTQLAWFRRYLNLAQQLQGRSGKLEQLNWYKQRRLEMAAQDMAASASRLHGFLAAASPDDRPLADSSHLFQAKQILRELDDLSADLGTVVKQEFQNLQFNFQAVSLTTLLKQSLDRIQPLIQSRQLWVQLHNQESKLPLNSDPVKLAVVFYEVLISACDRCPTQGRLDLWCRLIDVRWLELSITDGGSLSSQTLKALQSESSFDQLAMANLAYGLDSNLFISQLLIKQMGGELTWHKLDDGRTLTRLILPVVPHFSSPEAKQYAVANNPTDSGY